MTLDPTVRIICFDCAKENGAIWPEGHAATVWIGACGACGKTVAVCDVADWDWPRGKRPAAFSILNRD